MRQEKRVRDISEINQFQKNIFERSYSEEEAREKHRALSYKYLPKFRMFEQDLQRAKEIGRQLTEEEKKKRWI